MLVWTKPNQFFCLIYFHMLTHEALGSDVNKCASPFAEVKDIQFIFSALFGIANVMSIYNVTKGNTRRI